MEGDNPQILVVGSINMDLVVRTPRRPAPGETVLGDGFTTSPGGKGANQAVAVARLGGNCAMIGRVGDDGYGRDLREGLQQEGVHCAHVLVAEGEPSGVAMIVVDSSGENSIIVASGANFRLTPDDLFARQEAFEAAAVVLLQLELPLPTIRAAIKLARRHGAKVVLDPAPAHKCLHEDLYRVDVISPNSSEAEILTGRRKVEERVDKLVAADFIERGAKAAVLKLGPRGAMVIDAEGHISRARPYKVDVVDTTAAGDAFTGALAVAMTRGEKLSAAAQFANAAGALACTRYGAQQAMPTAAEVKMLMDDQPAP